MEKKSLIITILEKTPSIDGAYWHRGNVKILKNEYRDLRERIQKIVSDKNFKFDKETKLKVQIAVSGHWITKKNTIYKSDLANKEKFLIDSIFPILNIDDRQIWDLHLSKIDSKNDFTVIEIEELI